MLMFTNKQSKQIVLIGMLLVVALFVGGSMGTAQAQTDYSTAPDCSTVSYNGSGTDADPYKVDDPYTLMCIGNSSATTYTDHFIITNDIELNVTSGWYGGDGWSPIASGSSAEFNGTMDGQGYTIYNLTAGDSLKNEQGLIGVVGIDGLAKNIFIKNVDIKSNYASGGFVGVNKGGEIRNISVTGYINGTNAYTGGIAGSNSLGGLVKNAYFNGHIDGSNFTGGIVGDQIEGSTENTYSTGDISSNESAVGSIAGRVSGTINQSYSDSTLPIYGFSDMGNIDSDTTSLVESEMTGVDAKINMTGFDFNNNWIAVDSGNGYTTDGYPILTSLNETSQLSAQSISSISYYDLTVNIDHNGTGVDTDYEILDGTDTVVDSGTTGSDGQIVKNLEQGTYEVQLAYSDAEFRDRNETVTLDADKTINHSLNKLSYNLTVDTSESGSSVNTTYVLINSDGNAVENGHTGSDGTVTHEIQYDTYTITIADEYESTVAVDETERKFDNATRSITLSSDSTESFDLNISQYDLTINTTETGSESTGVNVSYNITQDGTVVSDGYTDGEVVETLEYGTYNISVAGGDTYVENTTEVLHNQTYTLEFNLVEQSSDVVVTDSGSDGQSGLFASLGFIGSVFTGLVAVLTIFGIVYARFNNKV